MSEPARRDCWRETSYDERVRVLLDLATERYADGDAVAEASLADLAMLLGEGRHVDACEAAIMVHLQSPGSGPFWMMQLVMVMYRGGTRLSDAARRQIRRSWEEVRQLRGDTENHWVLYHACLHLAAELDGYEDLAWENGRTSEENRVEAVGWLRHWIHGAVRLGQSEYNPTHYIAEYAIPLLMLAQWTRDDELAVAARMMLDHLFAELATVSLYGVLRGPHARTDDTSVVEPWNSMTSLYSWLLFGSTQPATARNDWWNGALAQLAHGYRPPEVLRRIALDPPPVRHQHDRARSRRMLRETTQEFRTIVKKHYLRPEYAVGSTQGGPSDPIQSHVWDVTWHVADPRDAQPTFFSAHPHQTGSVLQTYFSCAPEPMAASVPYEGKPSFGEPDSVVGSSPYEQVVQHDDTLIALYEVPAHAPVHHVNTFVSRDLVELSKGDSGWYVARAGEAFLAFLPLSEVEWAEHRYWLSPWDPASDVATGSRLLVSRGGSTGIVVQVAAAHEFTDLAAFRAAVERAPLDIEREPMRIRMTSIRGAVIEFEHGRPPLIDGVPRCESPDHLFSGTHMNSMLGSGVVSIRHGDLERVLDFSTLETTDIDHGAPVH